MLEPETVYQIVGYAVLAERFGMDGETRDAGAPVARLGVYWSRAGRLAEFPLESVCGSADRANVADGLVRLWVERSPRTRNDGL